MTTHVQSLIQNRQLYIAFIHHSAQCIIFVYVHSIVMFNEYIYYQCLGHNTYINWYQIRFHRPLLAHKNSIEFLCPPPRSLSASNTVCANCRTIQWPKQTVHGLSNLNCYTHIRWYWVSKSLWVILKCSLCLMLVSVSFLPCRVGLLRTTWMWVDYLHVWMLSLYCGSFIHYQVV